MTSWQELDQELALWQEAGKQATFWWRDDDAIEPTDALEKLLAISSQHSVPCVIAVVPHLVKPALADVPKLVPTAFPVQHGFQHKNHAPIGEKEAEFGDHRVRSIIQNELRMGWEKLQSFERLAPVFVPPWNRMTDDLNVYLASIGFCGVSQFTPRKAEIAKGGLRQVNTHVDIINWRTTRGFAGEAESLAYVLSHLQNRRRGEVDSDEPTGILTHHLDHDDGCWSFMENFLSWTNSKSNVRWLTPFEAFKIDVP